MDSSTYKSMEVIGHITSAITRAKNIDEAINAGIGIIVSECSVDYAIVWMEDVKGECILHPNYWICPLDFTGKTRTYDGGTVGRVYKNQETERFLEYSSGDDPETEKDFSDINIGSMVCVPLSDKTERIGCIQFVNSTESPKFSDEDADTFEMLTTMIAIYIGESIRYSREFEERKIIISARNIKKQFKNGEYVSQILKGVNLNIYEGEFVVLLGESGCGKSTLMNIIGGLERADEGELSFMDTDLFNATEDELTKYRRDNIGFIFQSYNLMPNLNAKENLDLIAELVDDPLDSGETLELVGMGGKTKSYPSALSGGQQQRISIARALVKKPKVIMADEPTAALDYDTSITVLKVLEDIKKAGTTLLMVTHNEEIAKMADRVVRIRNGRMHEVKINIHPLHAEELVW